MISLFLVHIISSDFCADIILILLLVLKREHIYFLSCSDNCNVTFMANILSLCSKDTQKIYRNYTKYQHHHVMLSIIHFIWVDIWGLAVTNTSYEVFRPSEPFVFSSGYQDFSKTDLISWIGTFWPVSISYYNFDTVHISPFCHYPAKQPFPKPCRACWARNVYGFSSNKVESPQFLW